MRKLAILFTAALVLSPLALGQSFTLLDRTVVNVKRTGNELEMSIDGKNYSKRDLNFQLAEMHLHVSSKHRVFVLLDESCRLSDIALVTGMAVRAGFTSISAYVVFAKSGNMAELVYGPVEKISDNPGSRTRDKRNDSADHVN